MPTARVSRVLHALAPPADGEGAGDGPLLDRFRASRDETAFAALVRRHGPVVYGVCHRILGNGADADDAFQATFLVLARKAGSIRSASAVGSWLYGVAVKTAQRARTQAIQRRVRHMAAAKPEAVREADPTADLWAVLDEELSALVDPLRRVILTCDVRGLSRAKAAVELGWPEGTVAKRLARARTELARRLVRRGITLSAAGIASALEAGATASVGTHLTRETARQGVAFAAGRGAGSLSVQKLAEGVMRSMNLGAAKAFGMAAILVATIAGGLLFAEGPKDLSPQKAEEPRPAAERGAMPRTMWKERTPLRLPGWLAGSLAYAPDGKTLVIGGTEGHVWSVDPSTMKTRWTSKVPASWTAVAVSSDSTEAWATYTDGVAAIVADTGKLVFSLSEKGSRPSALALLPTRKIEGVDPKLNQSGLVIGSTVGYHIMSWIDPKVPGTIHTRTGIRGVEREDSFAAPLATDPNGTGAAMIGPIDTAKGKNVFWVYACGNHDKDSPGNRVVEGHEAIVTAAAWSADGKTFITGDLSGIVIIRDGKTLKEQSRLNFGSRILAVAASGDGNHMAVATAPAVKADKAYHERVYVWAANRPLKAIPEPLPMAGETPMGGEFRGAVGLAFAPDGRSLAASFAAVGQPIDGKITGRVRVWDVADASPSKADAPTVTRPLASSTAHVAFLDRDRIVVGPNRDGKLEVQNWKTGTVLSTLSRNNHSIGSFRLTQDRKWLVAETSVRFDPTSTAIPSRSLGVMAWNTSTLTSQVVMDGCDRILAAGHDGRTVAVVTDGKIQIWDINTGMRGVRVPFEFRRIDCAAFSPDSASLAISGENEVVVWSWRKGDFRRYSAGRRIQSLAFSADGKQLIEGPDTRTTIVVRDVATLRVATSLQDAGHPRVPFHVEAMAVADGGQFLVSANKVSLVDSIPVPYRIHVWNLGNGELTQQLAVAGGHPRGLALSPDGQRLAVVVEGPKDKQLQVFEWNARHAPEAIPLAKLEWKAIDPISHPEFDIQSIDVSKDGRRVAIGFGKTAVFDTATFKRLYDAPGTSPRLIGDDLFTWGAMTVQRDAATGKEKKKFPEPRTEFAWHYGVVSPNGKLVAGFDGMEVQVRDVATGFEPVRLAGQVRPQLGGSWQAGSRRTGIAWSPDGKRLAGFHVARAVGLAEGLAIWDLESGRMLAHLEQSRLEFQGLISRIAFSPDGKTIAVDGLTNDVRKDGAITLVDSTTLKPIKSIPIRSRDGGADVTAIAFSPDGTTIAAAVSLHSGKAPLNRIGLWDLTTNEWTHTFLPDHETPPIAALAFTPDARTLIAGTGTVPAIARPQGKEVLHRILVWRGEEKK